jgi:hypothetical protein
VFLSNIWGLLAHPAEQWKSIHDDNAGFSRCLVHLLVLAAIPPVAGYIGAAHVGWRIGAGPIRHVTADSALLILISSYVALVVCVLILGRVIHWMAKTYGSEPVDARATALAVYSATPLFLIGLIAVYPSLWLFMLASLLGIAYSVYLLYTGVPVLMEISREQGFVFSSAILTVGLVMVVGLMTTTVLFWSFGMAPTFT